MGASFDQISDSTSIPRAEEIIAETYRQVSELRSSGGKPGRVTMSRQYWNQIQEYRWRLGTLQGNFQDYLTDNSLFGLEIWYSNDTKVVVD